MKKIYRETDTNVEISSYIIEKNVGKKLEILSYKEKLFLLNTTVESLIFFIFCLIIILLESFIFNHFVTANSFNSSLLLATNLITIIIFLLFVSNYIYFNSKRFFYKNVADENCPSRKWDDSDE